VYYRLQYRSHSWRTVCLDEGCMAMEDMALEYINSPKFKKTGIE
jgi:hypothetical protein